MPVLVVILIISFLVIIHELGHLVAAKKAKVKVEEFGIGYPPRVLKLFKWGETVFSLNLIPIGGFVKLEGEHLPEDQSASEKKSQNKLDQKLAPFYQKSAKKRVVIILAGVIVNTVFAVLAFSTVFSFKGIPTALNNQARIGWISPDSPAQQANLPTDYNITQVKTDTQTYSINSISQVQQAVLEQRGQNLELVLQGPCQKLTCQNQTRTVEVYARTQEETPQDQGALGIIFKDAVLHFYPWYQMPFRATWYGVRQALMMGWMILQALAQVFVDIVAKGKITGDVAGPVGIVYHAQQGNLITQDFLSNLGFAGMLSLNLAVMNLLPIPALDGGRALFIFLEKIFDKKKVQNIERYANYGGFILLISLIIFITFQDILNIVQ